MWDNLLLSHYSSKYFQMVKNIMFILKKKALLIIRNISFMGTIYEEW